MDFHNICFGLNKKLMELGALNLSIYSISSTYYQIFHQGWKLFYKNMEWEYGYMQNKLRKLSVYLLTMKR